MQSIQIRKYKPNTEFKYNTNWVLAEYVPGMYWVCYDWFGLKYKRNTAICSNTYQENQWCLDEMLWCSVLLVQVHLYHFHCKFSFSGDLGFLLTVLGWLNRYFRLFERQPKLNSDISLFDSFTPFDCVISIAARNMMLLFTTIVLKEWPTNVLC